MTDLNCGNPPYVSLRRPSLEVQEDGSVLVRIENDTYRFTNISLGSVVECAPDGNGILIDGVLCPFPDSTEPRYPLITAPTNPDTPEAREAAWPVIKEGNEWSVVLGWNNIDNASASTEVQGQSYILGLNNTAHETAGVNNVLIGYGNEVDGGYNSILIGTQAKSHFNGTINMGFAAETSGVNGVAIGGGSKAAQNSVAIGSSAEAAQRENIALGRQAKANGASSVAVGHTADVAAPYSAAIGMSARVTVEGFDSVAIGRGAVANDEAVVSVGRGSASGNGAVTRKVVNVSNGTNANDAVNKSQLDDLLPTGTEGQFIGFDAAGNPIATDAPEGVIRMSNPYGGLLPAPVIGDGANLVVVGGPHTAVGDNGLQIMMLGGDSYISDNSSFITMLGLTNSVDSGNAENGNSGLLVVGNNCAANGNIINSALVGVRANIYTSPDAMSSSCAVIGVDCLVTDEGAGSISNVAAVGSRAYATESNTFSIGTTGEEKRIRHVLPGTQPTDAINKAQLDERLSPAARAAINSISPIAEPTATSAGECALKINEILAALKAI